MLSFGRSPPEVSVRGGQVCAVESCKWVTNGPILSRQGVGLPVLQPGPVWAYQGEWHPVSESWLPPEFSKHCTSVDGTQPLSLFISAVKCW